METPSRQPKNPRPKRTRTAERSSHDRSFWSRLFHVERDGYQSDAKTGHRIYRLKGYTTVAKVNRQFHQERRQRTLRNILTALMIVILLLILFAVYNPLKDLDEWKRVWGQDSYYRDNVPDETVEPIIAP